MHIPFFGVVKSKFLAHLPVDPLADPVVFNLILLLYKFSAFAYYYNYRYYYYISLALLSFPYSLLSGLYPRPSVREVRDFMYLCFLQLLLGDVFQLLPQSEFFFFFWYFMLTKKFFICLFLDHTQGSH